MRLIAHKPTNWMFGPEFGFNPSACSKSPKNTDCGFAVKMDIAENDASFKILAEVPGMTKDDITITVKDNLLTLSGERPEKNDDIARLVWSERSFGRFSRSFKLPESIDKSGVSADYSNGLLSITLPKREEAQPKSIDVKIN
ncbi:MAG: Hsp20/alpha crystallin family protein [FCB group bacterium]|nr:Hsp20/alpha crystallin family protein [FCB group bacterium]